MIRNLIFTIIGISLFCRCAPTRKFDYGTAYKFKYIRHHPPKEIQPDPELLDPKFNEIYASLVEIPSPPDFIEIQETDIQKEEKRELTESRVDTREFTLSGKEKRMMRAELRSLIKSVKRSDIQKKRRPSSYSNTHPAMQGFIIALVGFGVILASVLIGVQTLSAVMLIVGFIIIGYGILKILMNR